MTDSGFSRRAMLKAGIAGAMSAAIPAREQGSDAHENPRARVSLTQRVVKVPARCSVYQRGHPCPCRVAGG